MADQAQPRAFHHGGRLGFVLVHGLAGTPIEVRYVGNALQRAGHVVECPELAGHGGSVSDLRNTCWEDWYGSIEASLERVRRQCDIVIVGGLSIGAMLALNLAADHADEIDGVMLFSPTLKFDGWSVPWYSFLVRMCRETPIRHIGWYSDRWPHGIKNERLRQFVVRQMMSNPSQDYGPYKTPGEALRQMVRIVDHVRPKLPAIKQPALILHARDDDMASLGNTAYLQKKLGGQVETFVLDDSYHMITIDQQRDLVVERTQMYAAWVKSKIVRTKVAAAASVTAEVVAAE